MPPGSSCPICGSDDLDGRGYDLPNGDEASEIFCRFCYATAASTRWHPDPAERAWNVTRTFSRLPPHRSLTYEIDPLERSLIAEIHAAPDDDAPRLVYADWLQARRDPLGTFIALQLRRAADGSPPSGDELALLTEHWSAWIGVPSNVVGPYGVVFERGLWSECAIIRRYHDLLAPRSPAVDSPSWSTVRRLALCDSHDTFAADLVARLAPSLRELKTDSPDLVARLATWSGPPLAIRELTIVATPRFLFDDVAVPANLDGLPSLERLRIASPGPLAIDWQRIAGSIDVSFETTPLHAGFTEVGGWPVSPAGCGLPRR